jgi:hypothetical protein
MLNIARLAGELLAIKAKLAWNSVQICWYS